MSKTMIYCRTRRYLYVKNNDLL